MNLRITGMVEIIVIVVAMLFGATFTFFAYELGKATKPGEMKVWNTTGDGGSSTSGSSSSGNSMSTSPPSSTPSVQSGPGAGKTIFEKNCNGCHPGRQQGVGPALNENDLTQRYPQDADLVKVIRGGRGIMPPFSTGTISDADLPSLVAYLRSAP